MVMIEKPTEIDDLHRCDSPKMKLRQRASEKATLDTGGDARKCPIVALQ